jgi:hypothetical protein
VDVDVGWSSLVWSTVDSTKLLERAQAKREGMNQRLLHLYTHMRLPATLQRPSPDGAPIVTSSIVFEYIRLLSNGFALDEKCRKRPVFERNTVTTVNVAVAGCA